MPALQRPDGVEIHWEERGSGPLVVIGIHWSGVPGVFGALAEDLSADHRVVLYDARGTGRSTRRGPHDMATGSSDLEALLLELGDAAVLVGLTDFCNRAVRVGAGRAELVEGVIAQGTAPVARSDLAGTDAMAASEGVVEGLIGILEKDYRAAQHNLMSTANPQMDEEQVRQRVDVQVAYCPAEVGIERLRAWVADEPVAAARGCADRLWITFAPGMVGPWFPPYDQLSALVASRLPEARLIKLDDGLVSRPDQTAEVVRRLHRAET